MAKFAVIVIFICALYFGSLKYANALEDQEKKLSSEEDTDAEERSAIIARARVKITSKVATRQRNLYMSPPGTTVPVPVPFPSQPSFHPTAECYNCIDCPVVLSNTSTKICPPSWDGRQDTMCVTYVEKYNDMKTPWTVRGCASERGYCKEIKEAHEDHTDVKLLSCDECEGDFCNNKNGAPRSLSDITMAFVVLVVTPLVAKCTMS